MPKAIKNYEKDLENAIEYVLKDFRKVMKKKLFENKEYCAGMYIDDSLFEYINMMTSYTLQELFKIMPHYTDLLIEKSYENCFNSKTLRGQLNDIYQDIIYYQAVGKIEAQIISEYPGINLERK